MGSLIRAKRGRPVGSKNKPKTVRMTKVEVDLCKKVGVPIEAYAKEKVALQKKPRRTIKKKVNWERLAKQLQTALNDEIWENHGLSKQIEDLKYQVANLEHQAIGYRAVVSYLENNLANHTV